jgi:hypothetical protein
MSGSIPEKWDGRASMRILDILKRIHGEQTGPKIFASSHGSRQLMPMGTFD